MQKILSARLEEAAIHEMEKVTRRLGITKRQFLEEAIHRHAQALSAKTDRDTWSETFGAWKRKESTVKTISTGRRAFRKSLERHRR
jgi:hypothetical protein